MESKNILKLLFILPNNVAGGAERVMTSLINNFCDKKINTFFMTFDSNSNFYELSEKAHIIRLHTGTENLSKFRKKILLPFIEIKRYCKMKKNIREIKPNCVISFMFMPNIIGTICCKQLNVPIILSERNDPNEYSKMKRKIMKIFYSKADGFVCQSNKMKELVEIDYNLNNVIVIPNPLTKDQISLIKPQKVKTIISVGRLIPQKNHELLINAFSEIADNFKEYNLIIYGEGYLRKELETQIKRLNLEKRVFLPGIEKNPIKNHCDASLFVLSSRFEGFPNVLVEAMANGIVSISSDFSSGCANDIIIDGKNGFLFETGNRHELVQKMKYCLSNDLSEVSDNGRKIYKLLNIDNISNKWLDYIKSIIEEVEDDVKK